jgi:hypothetical protein
MRRGCLPVVLVWAAATVVPALAAASAKPKVVILGFDGADARLVQQWMDQGKLPNLAKLRDDGTFAPLQPTNPPQTPVSWSSFATDDDRKTRVLSLTRRMLSETDFGRQDAFQSLWSSMEELLLTYNERPFVSASYRTGLDQVGGRAAQMASDVPADLVEMMDSLAIRAAEAAVHPNFPDADTVLIVELDGPAAEVRALFDTVEELCRRHGATTIEVAQTDEQRMRIWRGRKAAFAAMGRVSPNYYVQDGVVPRTKLPQVLNRIRALEARSGLRIGNVFHAGDGNLHPLICYDERIPGQSDAAAEVAAEILSYCIEAGGSLTGEHGIGADKSQYMPTMFTPDDLALMQRVRTVFDPLGLCNPGKVFPTPRLCGEVPGPYRRHPVEAAGVAERF